MKKQVIVIRTDLNMRKGKMIAQGSHGVLGAILSISKIDHENKCITIPMNENLKGWLYDGLFTKICVRVDSENELLDVYNKAKNAGLMHCLIEDAGKTEFHGNKTYTVVVVGPAEEEEVNKITGHLKLL